ncbi:MAG: metalloregulator ArsR/SmtB family transcription factor [Bauldia sp.]
MLNYQVSLDHVFAALADPARRAMVERLTRGPASVSELAQPFAMSLPGIVQHLKVLEESGLVSSVKVGRVRTCRVEAKALSAAERWFAERRAFWEEKLDRLGAFLDAGAADTVPARKSRRPSTRKTTPKPRKPS